jgi:hypothetical protein
MARVLWQAKRDSEAARFILQAIDITKQIDDINGLPSKLLLWSIILEESRRSRGCTRASTTRPRTGN